MRSGFVSFVGRPNVGKSTLLNAICGKKVSIVSDKPQTTRNRIRGVLTTPETQLIFVDTPGIHKAVSALGERVNATAIESTKDVDVVHLQDNIINVANDMMSKSQRRRPVVENGKLVGQISCRQLLLAVDEFSRKDSFV